MQLLLERVEHLRAPPDRFGQAVGTDRHDHEFLDIDRVVGMFAAIDDVHHRHRQDMRRNAANITIEWQAARIRGGLGHRHAGAKDSIGADPALVGRAIERDHRQVDIALVLGIERADQHVADLGIHRIHRIDHALAQIAGLVAIAEFDGFMRAGRGSAGHRGAAKAAIVEQNIDLDRGITPRIENFAGVDIDDRGHGAGAPGKGVVIG